MKFARPGIAGGSRTQTGWTSVSAAVAAVASAIAIGAASLNPYALTLDLQVSGASQTVTAGGTITGTAPFGVYFDCTGTTASDSALDPWLALGYHHDYGYATEADAGYWAYPAALSSTERAKCRYVGSGVSGHVYQTPGTYTASVRVEDILGNYDDKFVTVVVQDPAVVYAGALTVLCSTDGSSDATNYPGATIHNVTASGMPTPAVGRRYLFKRGQTFSSVFTIPTAATGGTALTDIQIGAWGSGDLPYMSALPYGVITATNPSNASNNLTPQFPSRITVSDLKGGVTVQSFCSYYVVQRCDMRDRPSVSNVPSYGQDGANTFESLSEGTVLFTGTVSEPVAVMDNMAGGGVTGQVWPNPRDLHFIDNLVDMVPQGVGDHGTFFVYGRNLNHCGNYFGPNGGHQTRMKGGHCALMAFNYYTGDTSYNAGSVITIRSEKRNTSSPELDNASPPNATRTVKVLGQSGRMNTRYICIDRNQICKADFSSTVQSMLLSTQFFNDAVTFKIRDVLYQRNTIYRGAAATQNEINFYGGNRCASRGNITYPYTGGSRGPQTGAATNAAQRTNYLQSDADYTPYYITTGDSLTGALASNYNIVPALPAPDKAGT